MMKYERPTRITAGDLLWYGLSYVVAGRTFGVSVIVEVLEVRKELAEVRLIMSGDGVLWVPTASLYVRRKP